MKKKIFFMLLIIFSIIFSMNNIVKADVNYDQERIKAQQLTTDELSTKIRELTDMSTHRHLSADEQTRLNIYKAVLSEKQMNEGNESDIINYTAEDIRKYYMNNKKLPESDIGKEKWIKTIQDYCYKKGSYTGYDEIYKAALTSIMKNYTADQINNHYNNYRNINSRNVVVWGISKYLFN